jgi:hypothetical protein
MMRERSPVVAIGLLTQLDLDLLGDGFRRAFPIDDSSSFETLLRAIDESSSKQARRESNGHTP